MQLFWNKKKGKQPLTHNKILREEKRIIFSPTFFFYFTIFLIVLIIYRINLIESVDETQYMHLAHRPHCAVHTFSPFDIISRWMRKSWATIDERKRNELTFPVKALHPGAFALRSVKCTLTFSLLTFRCATLHVRTSYFVVDFFLRFFSVIHKEIDEMRRTKNKSAIAQRTRMWWHRSQLYLRW